MRVYVYVSDSTGITALTVDQTGDNLPAALGPWHREARAALTGREAGPQTAPDALEQALQTQGYYLASAGPLQMLLPGTELNDDAYGRADTLANAVIEHLTRESQSVLVIVGALELATVRILNTLDQTGAGLEAFIADLRRIFSETDPDARTPGSRH